MIQSAAADSIAIEDLDRLFAARLEEGLRAAERERYDEPADALLWAALAPGWTPALARSCGFPGVEGGVERFFERLVERGLAERRKAAAHGHTASEPYYVMGPVARGRVLGSPPGQDDARSLVAARARALFGRDRPDWRRAAAEIGLRMAHEARTVPAALVSWARLAALAGDGASLVDGFDRMVRDAADAHDSAAVLDLIDAARPFATLAARDQDERLVLAIQRAGRRLELLHRGAMDEQHLRLFLRRADQIEAFERLMQGDARDPWALHFIGAGGVGKTMLLRYLTVELGKPVAQRRDFGRLDAAVARVDFDYLNADYPSLAPGLLLWAFAQDLRAFDRGGGAAELFDKADSMFEEVHRSLRAGGAAQQPTGHPLFAQALVVWADALRRLDRQVLLIIDTCEELGRLRPGGRPLPNVEETFRILEALHDGVDTLDGEPGRGGVGSLRVVFSGRRPLAAAGCGWRCAAAAALPPRAYLGLHQLRGFSQAEARVYLERQLDCGGAAAALCDAIIAGSSPDAGSAVQIDWDDAARRPAELPRCNPYELRLHLDWALEDPPPAPEEIASATSDQYVELRILRRLHDDPLERALPAAALLGHFDRALLAAACGGDEAVFDRLAEQEWTSARSAAVAGQPLVLDVDSGVRRRLRAYHARRGGPGTAMRERARRHLEALTVERSLATLDWPVFDAALSALEHDPDAGARWWSSIEARLFAERDADWVVKLTEPLLGADGACGEPEAAVGPDLLPPNPLRAHVLATHSAALAHAGQTQLARSGWEAVTLLAVGAGADTLRARALAARLALLGQLREPIDGGDVGTFCARVDALDALDSAQQLAGIVAAAEALIERAERPLAGPAFDPGPAASFVHLAQLAVAVAQSGVPRAAEPAAIACSLAGRALRRGPGAASDEAAAREAMRWLHESIRLADASVRSSDPEDEQPPDPGDVGRFRLVRPSRWADWSAPDDVAARVRLELLRAACPAWLAPADALAAASSVTGVADADGERLQSALLALRLDQHPVALADLAPLGWVIDAAGAPVPRSDWPAFARLRHAAHLATPPLVVTVARAFAAGGAPQAALDQLTQVIESGRQRDPFAARAAQAERLRLVLRWRLDTAPPIGADALADVLAGDPPLARALALVGTRSDRGPAPASADPTQASAAPAWRDALRAGKREAPAAPQAGLVAAAAGFAGALGERAAAEIALDEGAWLGATGSTPHAIEALAWARDAFARAGDDPGCLIATALIALHAPDDRRAGAIDDLRRRHEACAAGLGLPGWSALEAAAKADDPAAIDALAPPVWQPWLARIVAAIAGPARDHGQGLARWLERRYPAAQTTPTEWLRWRALRGEPLTAAAPAPAAAAASGSNAASRWLVVLGVGVLALVGWGLFALFAAGAKRLLPSFPDLGIGMQLFWFAGLLVGLGAAAGTFGGVRRRLAAWRASLGWVELSVTAAEGSDTAGPAARPITLAARTVAARLDRRGRLHPRFPFWPVVHTAGEPTTLPALAAPRRQWDPGQWEAAAQALAPVLRDQAAKVKPFGLDLVLRVDPGLHEVDWEAALAHAGGIEPADLASLRPRRAVAPPLRDPGDATPGGIGGGTVAVLADGEVAQGVVDAGWRRVRAADRVRFATDDRRAAVVHAIGLVEQTSAGLRLRLGDPAAATSKRTLEASAPAREWAARDLAAAGARVCIIQAPPAPGLRARLASDRYAAGLARAFAAEIAAAGVPFVVVLPPQRPADAAATIAQLAQAIDLSARKRRFVAPHRLARRIDDALAPVRARLATATAREGEPEPRWDALGRGLDLCFFCHCDPAP